MGEYSRTINILAKLKKKIKENQYIVSDGQLRYLRTEINRLVQIVEKA